MQAGHEVVAHGLGDQIVEFATFVSSGLIPVLGVDAQHRRQQRDETYGIQCQSCQFGSEQLEAVDRIGEMTYAATAFDQRTYRVQAGVGVEG